MRSKSNHNHFNNKDQSRHHHHHHQLWQDVYAPQTLSEVCLAPKKVKEITSWLETAMQNHTSQNKLLILVGSPGIGKSTTIRLLAQERGWNLLQWNESISSYQPNNNSNTSTISTSTYSADPYSDSLLSIEQSSPLSSFESFLRQAGAGYRSLVLLTGEKESSSPTKKRRITARNDTLRSGKSPHSIILLEDLPHLHGWEAQMRFQAILSTHIRESTVPTILIYSDVVEGKHQPFELEKLVDPQLLYHHSSHLVHILNIHPPTKARMKRLLDAILQKQPGLRHLASSSSSSSSSFFEEWYARSGGDVRFAITALQLEGTGLLSVPGNSHHPSRSDTSNNNNNNNHRIIMGSPTGNERDTRLTTFHALGKLLYAKRQPGPPRSVLSGMERWHDSRPPIEFDPERVVEHSQIELSAALNFLECHCVDFFTDIAELSRALDAYSDVAHWLDRPFTGKREDSVFPDAYAGSLAGRAVSVFNQHPAPNKFRQFTAPNLYDAMRKRDENQCKLANVSRRMAHFLDDKNSSMTCVFQPTKQFATDCLTYVRIIDPDTVNSSLGQMVSYMSKGSFERPTEFAVMGVDATARQHSKEEPDEKEFELLLKEQEEVLRGDEIAEFDSDDDDLIGTNE